MWSTTDWLEIRVPLNLVLPYMRFQWGREKAFIVVHCSIRVPELAFYYFRQFSDWILKKNWNICVHIILICMYTQMPARSNSKHFLQPWGSLVANKSKKDYCFLVRFWQRIGHLLLYCSIQLAPAVLRNWICWTLLWIISVDVKNCSFVVFYHRRKSK